MSRFLLALCLFVFAAAAMANNSAANDDPAGNAVKPGKSTSAGAVQDGDATAAGHPATPPARSGSTRVASPRWHSLLPGMIR